MNTPAVPPVPTSRRAFLRSSSTAAALALAAPAVIIRSTAFAANSDTLKLGLIGCGGRGTGAAGNALTADDNCVLTAVADVFPEPPRLALQGLKEQYGPRVTVTPDSTFIGLNGYKQLIDSDVDVVLLATPPGFRPMHLRYAVEKGKQIFCEKPVATDPVGLRHVLESVRIAKEKKLHFVSGFCWRSDLPRRELYRRIHDGAVGDIRTVYGTYLTGPVKPMPAASTRKSGVTDLEWQVRNWMNFSWLSGDGIVEQCIHTVDKLAWCMKEVPPIKCTATGGRIIPNNEGNIYDHMTIVYEYPGGVRGVVAQRQIAGCYNDNSDYIIGSKGTAQSGWNAPIIKAEKTWRYDGDKPKDMYVIEHEELFGSIRGSSPYRFDGDWLASSTLLGLMGRLAAYTGGEVTWDQAFKSKEDLHPAGELNWDMKCPIMPLPLPGQYKPA
ncbi:MAG TPA: Gfo/Idh/MocA family oxidoreductase [Verrucomicrobiota bacterium]|nr:oxidoreductase [Verrucomicrobiales bacterium]HRI14849.1 Gfo/Idh/MocA family oxidoreductase [Verrucomicrobiota bacterium]